jgi:chromosome segregation ATPase
LHKEFTKADKELSEIKNQMQQTTEEKNLFEVKLKQCQLNLHDCKAKLQNNSTFIQHSCKTTSLLKDEKESLEKILKDNVTKMKSLREKNEMLAEKKLSIESNYEELKIEMDTVTKTLNDIRSYNDKIVKENNEIERDLNKCKLELAQSITTIKDLNKKISQIITDKDKQVSQFEQQLSLYEKEINLLKQVETLHKNQEDNKMMEVTNTIQMKLQQKKTKIENLRERLVATELSNETFKKDLEKLRQEKNELELKLIKTEKETSNDLDCLRAKKLQYEMSSLKYANFEKKRLSLECDLNKFKQLINSILFSNEIILKTDKDDESVQIDHNKLVKNSNFITDMLNEILRTHCGNSDDTNTIVNGSNNKNL